MLVQFAVSRSSRRRTWCGVGSGQAAKRTPGRNKESDGGRTYSALTYEWVAQSFLKLLCSNQRNIPIRASNRIRCTKLLSVHQLPTSAPACQSYLVNHFTLHFTPGSPQVNCPDRRIASSLLNPNNPTQPIQCNPILRCHTPRNWNDAGIPFIRSHRSFTHIESTLAHVGLAQRTDLILTGHMGNTID